MDLLEALFNNTDVIPQAIVVRLHRLHLVSLGDSAAIWSGRIHYFDFPVYYADTERCLVILRRGIEEQTIVSLGFDRHTHREILSHCDNVVNNLQGQGQILFHYEGWEIQGCGLIYVVPLLIKVRSSHHP